MTKIILAPRRSHLRDALYHSIEQVQYVYFFVTKTEQEKCLLGKSRLWQHVAASPRYWCVVKGRNSFRIPGVLILVLCMCSSLQGLALKELPSMSVPNVSEAVDCNNFAHRLTICSSCACMLLLVVGVLLLIFAGKLRPQDLGNWKAGSGMAVIFIFLYEVFKVTLGNCKG